MKANKQTENTTEFAVAAAAKIGSTDQNKSQFAGLDNFIANHGVNAYISLQDIKSKGLEGEEDCHEILRKAIHIDKRHSYRNCCMACGQTISDIDHLHLESHAQKVASQQFRLNASVIKWEAYQQWISNHGIFREHWP